MKGLGLMPMGVKNLQAYRNVLMSGTASVRVPHRTNYSRGPYSVYAYVFGAGSPLVEGVDYNAYFTVYPSVFPKNTKINWKNPGGVPTTGAGIWGYHHIDKTLPAAIPICNLTQYDLVFKYSYTGSPHFNQLGELWVTDDPAVVGYSPAESLWELGSFWHTSDYTFHNNGTPIGGVMVNNGISYDVRRNGEFITTAPVNRADVLEATFSLKQYYDFLIANGAISGSEWLTGNYMLGPEPMRDAVGTQTGEEIIPIFDTTVAYTAGPPVTNYVGGNIYPNPDTMTAWNLTGVLAGTSVPDIDGTNNGLQFLETTGAAGAHNIFRAAANTATQTREQDFVHFWDIKPVGRSKFQLYIASGDFAHQLKLGYDTTAKTFGVDSTAGTGLVLANGGQQIIKMGNGWFRLVARFTKKAGIPQLYTNLSIKDDTGAVSYVGDVAKGVILRGQKHRLCALPNMSVSGAAPAGNVGTAYSWTPTVRGGQGGLTYTLQSGSLPAGLAIDTNVGVTGTPTTIGSSSFSIRAWTADSKYVELATTINIAAAGVQDLTFTFDNDDNLTNEWDASIQASGGKLRYNNTPQYYGRAATLTPALTADKYYQVETVISEYVGGQFMVKFQGGTERNGVAHSANGTFKERMLANAGNTTIYFSAPGTGNTFAVDQVRIVGPYDTATVDGA